MTASGNNPSLQTDPANNDTLSGVLQFVFKKLMQSYDHCLPAQIINYDRTTRRAQVQPVISILTTDGAQVPRAQVASIPIFTMGGGGFVLDFPLNPGDLGYILASDRDVSLFLQSYEPSAPNTARMFSFSDGLFLPLVMTGYTIAEGDAGNAVLQNLDGTVKISLGTAAITITAPNVIIDGALAATGGISISGGATPINITGNFQLTGDFAMTGDMLVTGNIGATGTITPGV